MALESILIICIAGLGAVMAAVAFGLAIPVIGAAGRQAVREADEESARKAARAAMYGAEAAKEKGGKAHDALERRLREAGIKSTPAQWAGRVAAVMAIAGFLTGILSGNVVLGLAVAAAVLLAAWFRVALARSRRTSRFERQLSDCLPMIAENLRSGQSAENSLIAVSRYMEDPLKEEFAKTAREMQLGLTFSAAMDNMYRRVACEDLRLVNGVIAISAESGGDLADILDSIAGTMNRRAQMRGHIRSITSSQRTSAIMVISLPWLILLALSLLAPSYTGALFKDPWVGAVIIGTVAVMDIVGFAVIRKMYSMKVE